MVESSQKTMHFIVAALIAAPVTFIIMFIYPALISGLPRPMQGEAVKVPWAICLAGFLILPVAAPWLVSVLLVRAASTRIVFLLALCGFVLLWYFGLDMGELLSKAWRRGL